MSEKSESLNYQDVVSLTDTKSAFVIPQPTFRVSELTAAIVGKLTGSDSHKEWAANGTRAEVLAGSKGWRKGKVRLTVEFIPDEDVDEPSEQ
jgi:hypothetical protein